MLIRLRINMHPWNKHPTRSLLPLKSHWHFLLRKPTDKPAQLKVKQLRANAFPSSSYTLQETFLPPALLSLFGRWWICSLSYHRPCVSDSHIQHPAKIKTDRSILHDIEEYLGHCTVHNCYQMTTDTTENQKTIPCPI